MLTDRWFKKNYNDLDEFKRSGEFQNILDAYVTLDSIKQAIKRADAIVKRNSEEGKIKENYRGFAFYRDNPDVSVHEVVKLIFEVCEVS